MRPAHERTGWERIEVGPEEPLPLGTLHPGKANEHLCEVSRAAAWPAVGFTMGTCRPILEKASAAQSPTGRNIEKRAELTPEHPPAARKNNRSAKGRDGPPLLILNLNLNPAKLPHGG